MCSMRLEMQMNQKLTTELRMAPHIIQSIEVLTLPILELQTFIEEQLQSNPVLETEEREKETDVSPEEPDIEASSATEERQQENPVDEEALNDFENLERDDWSEFYSQDHIGKRSDEDKDKKMEAMQNSADKPISLQDFLFEQFRLLDMPENLRAIGQQIIYNIDSNGYVRYPLEEIVKSIDPIPSLEDAKKALQYIQKLEPPGIGATSMQECLILQLSPDDKDYYFKKELIEKYLYDIYYNKYPKIAKETGRKMEDINAAIASIRKLNPKPGAEYSTEQSQTILPDAIVELKDGEYVIRLENDYIPQLRISPYYRNMVEGKKQDQTDMNPQAKEFIKKKIEAAHWIIEAIKQRQNTLYRVVQEAVQRQRDFLDNGINHLKPLRMQEVADTLSIHVSTVSRAIADKYIQTPRGIFPIKFFFTGSIDKKDGETESRVSVKERVQDMILQEDKKNPLSDEQIVEKLKNAGLDIARRTVTKYRKALGLASSRRRKHY